MYQFFVDEPIEVGQTISLSSDQEHHAKNVLRLNHEKVRIVSNEEGYFGEGYIEDNQFLVHILEKDNHPKELNKNVTLALALIRREKFELVLQKATELGVHQIIPFLSSRCVVQEKKEKSSRQMERWNKIVKEASAQCKRNVVPMIKETQTLEEVSKHNVSLKLVANSDLEKPSVLLEDALKKEETLIVIGPEGGFSTKEIELLEENGFVSVSLGNRILRAETACMYALSVISSFQEREF